MNTIDLLVESPECFELISINAAKDAWLCTVAQVPTTNGSDLEIVKAPFHAQDNLETAADFDHDFPEGLGGRACMHTHVRCARHTVPTCWRVQGRLRPHVCRLAPAEDAHWTELTANKLLSTDHLSPKISCGVSLPKNTRCLLNFSMMQIPTKSVRSWHAS